MTETSEGEKGTSSEEETVEKRFALDKDKYTRFLHNGYQMAIDDSQESTLGPTDRVNVARYAGMGEYEVHYSSDNDSDRDICDWLTSSESCVVDCFSVDCEEKEWANENRDENEVTISQLQAQLEEQRLSTDEIIRELLEKLALAQSKTHRAQLEAKQSKELVSAVRRYNREEIILLEQALDEKNTIISRWRAKVEASKGYIKALRVELQGCKEQEIEREINRKRRGELRMSSTGVQTRVIIRAGTTTFPSEEEDDALEAEQYGQGWEGEAGYWQPHHKRWEDVEWTPFSYKKKFIQDDVQSDEGMTNSFISCEYMNEMNTEFYGELPKRPRENSEIEGLCENGPPCKEVFLNTFMVQMEDTEDEVLGGDTLAMVSYTPGMNIEKQSSEDKELACEEDPGLLGNVSFRVGKHPAIHAKPRRQSHFVPKEGESTVQWEVEEGKILTLGSQLQGKTLMRLQDVLTKFKHVFAWSYEDLKGVKPEICQHYIDLEPGTKPLCQCQRCTNPVYAELVKAEITKLLNVGFIYPVAYSEWVSIVPKKNRMIRICVDYRKLNIVKLRKITFPYLSLIKYLIEWPGISCTHFWMDLVGITKFKFMWMISRKPLLPRNGALLHIGSCHLGFVMPHPLSSGP